MPNAIASIALIGWPLGTLALFQRRRPGMALVASLLVGYLLLPPLPAEFDPPMLPSLNKETIPSLSVVVIALALRRIGPRELLPGHPLMLGALAMFLFSLVMTVMTNTDPLSFGVMELSALRLVEVPGIVIRQALLVGPFLLTRALLRREEDPGCSSGPWSWAA